MSMNPQQLKNIVEAALLAANQPLNVDRLLSLFGEDELPSRDELKQALDALVQDYQDRGIELKEVSSGFRLQVRMDVAPWVARLWEERPSRYSRALLETLVLIAYKQPVTRGDIEDVRGVAVSSYIIKTLLERDWVRVLGHREVPGRPSLYGTTKQFLDYFNLKSLEDLPPLGEIRDLDDINASFDFEGLTLGDNDGDHAETSSEAVADLSEASPDETIEASQQSELLAEPAVTDGGESLAENDSPSTHENKDTHDHTSSNLTANG